MKNEGWTVVHHDKEALGPYAFKGDQWVGYDDIAMIKRKSQFVKDHGFGGAMIWALDLDDFNNLCGCENYPLLRLISILKFQYNVYIFNISWIFFRTINRELRNYPGPAPNCNEPTYKAAGYTLNSQNSVPSSGYPPHFNPYTYIIAHYPYHQNGFQRTQEVIKPGFSLKPYQGYNYYWFKK